MQLLDGKKVSEDIKQEITAEVAKMKANNEKVPHLAAIIVGNDGASLTYVGSKVKACERVGFESSLIKMPSTTSETELLKKIKELNTPPEDRWIFRLQYMGESGQSLYDELCYLRDKYDSALLPNYLSGYIDSETIDIYYSLYTQKYRHAQSFYDRHS